MFAKTPLILTLIVSLLFATQASQLTQPVEMKTGGVCARVPCAQGCCRNKTCCHVVEQQKSPQTPLPAPRDAVIPLGAVGLAAWTFLFVPPAVERPFVILDEVRAAHSIPTLASNCIRLI